MQKDTLILLIPAIIFGIVFLACGSTPPPSTTVKFVKQDAEGKVDIFVGEQLFSSYLYEGEILKKPVLYPLRSASDKVVTRGFPFQNRVGERVDHPHHYGLWFNHGDVNGLDFWNNSVARPAARRHRYGTIYHRELVSMKNGEVGVLRVKKQWLRPNDEVVLNEETEYRISGGKHFRQIDHWTQLTAVADTVLFADSKEGMFAIRVRRELELPSEDSVLLTDASLKPAPRKVLSNQGVSGDYLNSEGITGYDVWGKRASWVQLHGIVEGDSTSIVIMDHPDNPNHPPHWMARGYGLFGVNAFGSRVYTKGKEELNFQMQKGESITFGHRMLIVDGYQPSGSQLAEDYERFVRGEKSGLE